MTIGASYLYTPVTSCVTVFACFKSYKALVSADGRDDREWLTYWVLAALFDLLFVMTNCTLFIIPFYDEAKLGQRERECCLLVLNLVSSTLSCIRQPRPRFRVLDVCGFV